MRVKIISDSTCDLSPALLERYDIAVTPLCVIKDGKDFHDGVDITPADIFAHVDGGGDLCSTSAVSQYEYGEMFARYANEYDAVVQITIGANFSCCYQNACAATTRRPWPVLRFSESTTKTFAYSCAAAQAF